MNLILCESLESTERVVEVKDMPICLPSHVVLNVSHCITITDCIHQAYAELHDILRKEPPIICPDVS